MLTACTTPALGVHPAARQRISVCKWNASAHVAAAFAPFVTDATSGLPLLRLRSVIRIGGWLAGKVGHRGRLPQRRNSKTQTAWG